jgi:hypothetical protein
MAQDEKERSLSHATRLADPLDSDEDVQDVADIGQVYREMGNPKPWTQAHEAEFQRRLKELRAQRG